VEPLGAFMVYLPSMSVNVTVFVPFILTVACISGSPSASDVTVPCTVMVGAVAALIVRADSSVIHMIRAAWPRRVRIGLLNLLLIAHKI